MKLTDLKISRGYSKDGPLRGTIEFAGITGKVELVLDETLSKRIVAICADELVKASQSVAEAMTVEIINGDNLIEEKKQ